MYLFGVSVGCGGLFFGECGEFFFFFGPLINCGVWGTGREVGKERRERLGKEKRKEKRLCPDRQLTGKVSESSDE